METPSSSSGDRFAAAITTARRIVGAKYRTLGPEDREDLVATALAKYVKAFPEPGPGPGPGQTTVWLRQTLHTTFIDRWKAKQVRPQEAGVEPDAQADGHGLPFLVNALRMSPSVMAAWQDLEQRILGLIGPDDLSLFLAKDVDRVPARELAEQLAISVAAVEKRASRIRATLRAALEAEPRLLAELAEGMPQVHQHRPR